MGKRSRRSTEELAAELWIYNHKEASARLSYLNAENVRLTAELNEARFQAAQWQDQAEHWADSTS